jgi:tetratricopeptide (TPR) repeat protein
VIQLYPRIREPAAEDVIALNEKFWGHAWRHALKARQQTLNDDMSALLLHYASMRILFAQYCLWNGNAEECEEATRAIIELNTGPLIDTVNRKYVRQGFRYHMSQMPQVATMLCELAVALKEKRLSLIQVRQKFAQPVSEQPLEQLNQEGVHTAQQGNLAGALTIFDKVLSQAPEHVGARYNRAKVLARLGRTGDAIMEYKQLLSRSPNHVLALMDMADLLKVDNNQEALRLYERALSYAQNSPLEAVVKAKLQELRDSLNTKPDG